PSSGIGPVPIRPFSDWKNTVMPAGTKFATMVGMPMPRLTSMPDCSSRAMRLAMTVCASMMSPVCDEVIDQRRGRRDVVGRDDAHGHAEGGASATGRRGGVIRAEMARQAPLENPHLRPPLPRQALFPPLDAPPLPPRLQDGADGGGRNHTRLKAPPLNYIA